MLVWTVGSALKTECGRGSIDALSVKRIRILLNPGWCGRALNFFQSHVNLFDSKYNSVHFKLCEFDNSVMMPSKRHAFRSIFALFFLVKSFSKSALIKNKNNNGFTIGSTVDLHR